MNPKLSFFMDPQLPNLSYNIFFDDVGEFKKFYWDATEEMPQ